MKSKSYFVLRLILIILAAVLSATFILYLLSLVIFSLRASGVWFLHDFGFKGLGLFLISLPWLLILIVLILIIILEILVRRFSFSYRRPILYSVLAIMIFVLLSSWLISNTRLHSDLLNKAQQGRFSRIGEFYHDFGPNHPDNLYVGMVNLLTENGFELMTFKNQLILVKIDKNTYFPAQKEINLKDKVIILGQEQKSHIQAIGVRVINDKFNAFKHWHQRPHARMMK